MIEDKIDWNFESIWQLLSDYNFNIDLMIYRDLTCGICANILINPYRCNCGSRFCKKCIETYLNGISKYCPNSINNCSILISRIDIDLTQDNEINKIISMIKVKCPEKFCSSYIEVQNVLEHLKIHQIQCPYRNLGCMKQRLRRTSINNHLHSKVFNHTELLLNSIYHLQNDVTSMKEEIQLNKENILIKESYIKSIITELENLKLVDKQLSSETKLLKQTNDKYQHQMVKFNKKIEKMKKQIQKKNRENEIESQQLIKNEHSDFCESIKQTFDRDCFDKLYKRITKQLISPFEWNVDLSKISKENQSTTKIRRYKRLFSIPFYSHIKGYKICLRIDQGGLCSGFSIHFHIMKGEFDDLLVWPMPFEILIGLIDSVTNRSCLIKRFSHEYSDKNQKVNFEKPKNRMNESCGTNYIHLKNILNRSAQVKCVINVDK